jgi:phosphatidylglycerol:prolipoprotein diacylglycerol transferase
MIDLAAELGRGFPYPPWVHGVFVLLGTAAAVALFVREARRRGRLDERLVLVLLVALASGALAARLATLWRYLGSVAEPSVWGLVVSGGKSVVGGLAGAYLGVHLGKRLIGYRDGTGDLFAPAAALGIGVGRLGCLLTEMPGTPTRLPWRVALDAAQAARLPRFPAAWVGVPLHPSFVYEIAFQLAMLALLLGVQRRAPWTGSLFKGYLLAYALFRFAVEAVRGNEIVGWGLTRTQLFLVPSAFVLAAALAGDLRRRARPAVPPQFGGAATTAAAAVVDDCLEAADA